MGPRLPIFYSPNPHSSLLLYTQYFDYEVHVDDFSFSVVLSNVGAEGMDFIMAPGLRRLLIQRIGKLIFWMLSPLSVVTCKRCRPLPSLKKVGEKFYNPNFINVKIDMEKGDGLMLAGKYRCKCLSSSHSTSMERAGWYYKVIGYVDPEKFISAGKVALKKTIRPTYMPKEYDSGKRDFAGM
ncbi:MAG: hypothetical protein IPI77_17885 [Saprospiraceae bacterium]|nr:hypothetical protein [Saprospiraceae bacterium]